MSKHTSKMKPLVSVLFAVLLSGCGQSGGQSAATHPNGDPSKVSSVEGLVYSVDSQELLLQGTNSPLRFKLSEATAQQVAKGKHLSDLQKGDRIRVEIQYGGQGMGLKSFEILSFAADAKKSGDPHAGLNIKGAPGTHTLNTHSKSPGSVQTPEGLQSPTRSDKGENQNEKSHQ